MVHCMYAGLSVFGCGGVSLWTLRLEMQLQTIFELQVGRGSRSRCRLHGALHVCWLECAWVWCCVKALRTLRLEMQLQTIFQLRVGGWDEVTVVMTMIAMILDDYVPYDLVTQSYYSPNSCFQSRESESAGAAVRSCKCGGRCGKCT